MSLQQRHISQKRERQQLLWFVKKTKHVSMWCVRMVLIHWSLICCCFVLSNTTFVYVDLWLKYKSYFIIANNVGITMYNCAWTVLNLTVDGFNVYTTIPEICKRVHAIYVIYTVCTSLIVESSPGRTMHYTGHVG